MPNRVANNRISQANGNAVTPLTIRPSIKALRTSRYLVRQVIRFGTISYRKSHLHKSMFFRFPSITAWTFGTFAKGSLGLNSRAAELNQVAS